MIMQLQVACGRGAMHEARLPISIYKEISRTEKYYLLTCLTIFLTYVYVFWLPVFDVHNAHVPLSYGYHLVCHRRSKETNRNNSEFLFRVAADVPSCEQLAVPNTAFIQCQTGYTQTLLCPTVASISGEALIAQHIRTAL